MAGLCKKQALINWYLDVWQEKLIMTIKIELKSWDGKSVDDLEEIYTNYNQQKGFVVSLINLIEDKELQKAATWLLKHHLEKANKLTPSQNRKLISKVSFLESWESKLHLLQSLQYLTIPESEKDKLEHFLRQCLSEKNKFVRAWAYDGFYQLAKQYPEHIEETKQFFEMAMRDEPPSVISRIRNILKKGF